jgi:valyl-tRNA synthetase
VWNLTCDWYLELTKPVLSGEDGPAKDETRATVAWALDHIVALLHPFMPFISEELWMRMSPAGKSRPLLALSPWPTLDFEDEAAAGEINWLVDFIGAIRSVRSEMNVPAAATVPVQVSGATFVTARRLRQHDALIGRLARVETVSLASAPRKGAVQIVVGETTVSLPLAGIVDLDAEKARLSKELDRIGKEIERLDSKLANEQFMSRAPEEVIEEQRSRRTEAFELKNRTEAALARLAG